MPALDEPRAIPALGLPAPRAGRPGRPPFILMWPACRPRGADLGRGRPAPVGAPARRAEHHADDLPDRPGRKEVPHDRRPLMEGDADRIEGLDVVHDAVPDLLVAR